MNVGHDVWQYLMNDNDGVCNKLNFCAAAELSLLADGWWWIVYTFSLFLFLAYGWWWCDLLTRSVSVPVPCLWVVVV